MSNTYMYFNVVHIYLVYTISLQDNEIKFKLMRDKSQYI